MYQTIFDLISLYIYNNNIPVGSSAELVCTLVSTCACLFCIAFPFFLVWRFCKAIFGG